MHYTRLKYQTQQVERIEPHHACRQIMDGIPNGRRIILTCKTTVVVMMEAIMEEEEEITYWK